MPELGDHIVGAAELSLQPRHLLIALLVSLQQLLADVGGELEVLLLLLQESGDGFHIVIGPEITGVNE